MSGVPMSPAVVPGTSEMGGPDALQTMCEGGTANASIYERVA